MSDRLGIVTNASLEKGVDVRLDAAVPVEDMVVGRYVTIAGQKRRFFGMITDVCLGVTDHRLTASPPDTADPFMREVLTGTSTYGQIHVTPTLTIGGDADSHTRRPAAGQNDSPAIFRPSASPRKPTSSSSSARKTSSALTSAIRWIWRPSSALTCESSSNAPTASSARAARARPF